jgi:TRAP-type C4-dicarboxylate transport system permease small subunit
LKSAGRAAELAARALGAVAAAFLAAMMLLTVADVVLRAAFRLPIRGTFELIELGVACTVFVALPAIFLRGENLVVDAIDYLGKPSTTRVLDLIAACVSLALLTVMVLQMIPLARDMHEFGDVSGILGIPKIVYWIPVLLGIGGSAAATVVFIGHWKMKGN